MPYASYLPPVQRESSAVESMRNLELINSLNRLNQNKIRYESLDDLAKFVDLKCDSIELKFKIYILDFLIDTYLNEILRDRQKFSEINFTQYINVLFSLVFEKRTMIVR